MAVIVSKGKQQEINMKIKNGDMPAMPVNQYKRYGDLEVSEPVSAGMTKREIMAMHILPSLIESYEVDQVATQGESVVRDAVIYADLLLADLERTK